MHAKNNKPHNETKGMPHSLKSFQPNSKESNNVKTNGPKPMMIRKRLLNELSSVGAAITCFFCQAKLVKKKINGGIKLLICALRNSNGYCKCGCVYLLVLMVRIAAYLMVKNWWPKSQTMCGKIIIAETMAPIQRFFSRKLLRALGSN